MHHFHISTGALFLVLLFIFGIVGLIMWGRAEKKHGYKPSSDAAFDPLPPLPPLPPLDSRHAYGDRLSASYRHQNPVRSMEYRHGDDGYYYNRPPSGGPTIINNPGYGGGFNNDGLLAGMLMGEMIGGGNRETIIEENNGIVGGYGFENPSQGWTDVPYDNSGITYDSTPDTAYQPDTSGITYDSGSSSDVSDNSGGVDISW